MDKGARSSATGARKGTGKSYRENNFTGDKGIFWQRGISMSKGAGARTPVSYN